MDRRDAELTYLVTLSHLEKKRDMLIQRSAPTDVLMENSDNIKLYRGYLSKCREMTDTEYLKKGIDGSHDLDVDVGKILEDLQRQITSLIKVIENMQSNNNDEEEEEPEDEEEEPNEYPYPKPSKYPYPKKSMEKSPDGSYVYV